MKKYTERTSLEIKLTREQCDYVSERVAEYGSASEYMSELIRKDAAVHASVRLEELALEGLRSGPALPHDPDFFPKLHARIEAKARSIRAGKKKSVTRKKPRA